MWPPRQRHRRRCRAGRSASRARLRSTRQPGVPRPEGRRRPPVRAPGQARSGRPSAPNHTATARTRSAAVVGRNEDADGGALVAEVDAFDVTEVLAVDLDRRRNVARNREVVQVVEVADPARPAAGVTGPEERIDGPAPESTAPPLAGEDHIPPALEGRPPRTLRGD